jgi:hypothetical protein
MLDGVSVIRHLRRHGSLSVKLGPFTNVWTPERPRPNHLPMGFYQMPGRGLLTYTMDPEGETVHLRWQPKRGPAREWTGPVPVVATPEFRKDSRRGIGVALIVFLVIEGLGAGLGVMGGSILGGLGAGLVAGYFAAATVWGDKQQHAFIHAYEQLRHPPDPASPAADQATETIVATQSHEESQDHLARKRKHRLVLRALYTVYGLILVAGFLVGYFLTGGSPGRRFLAATLGLIAAMGVSVLLTELMRGGRALKRLRQSHGS